MSELSPLPWSFQPYSDGIKDQGGCLVVEDGSMQTADAEFIVKAVNHHDELVAALKESRCEFCGFFLGCPRGDCKVCARRVAILAKVGA